MWHKCTTGNNSGGGGKELSLYDENISNSGGLNTLFTIEKNTQIVGTAIKVSTSDPAGNTVGYIYLDRGGTLTSITNVITDVVAGDIIQLNVVSTNNQPYSNVMRAFIVSLE